MLCYFQDLQKCSEEYEQVITRILLYVLKLGCVPSVDLMDSAMCVLFRTSAFVGFGKVFADEVFRRVWNIIAKVRSLSVAPFKEFSIGCDS